MQSTFLFLIKREPGKQLGRPRSRLRWSSGLPATGLAELDEDDNDDHIYDKMMMMMIIMYLMME